MYAYLTILTGQALGHELPARRHARDAHRPRHRLPHHAARPALLARPRHRHAATTARWIIRDQESRNGTTVNGQKIDEATLADGNAVKLGSHEFEFRLSAEPATAQADDARLTQTIVQDLPIAVRQSNEEVLAALPTPEQVQELMLLYQLAIRLLGCDDPDEVIRISLELLKERTKAAVDRLPVGRRRGSAQAQAGDSRRAPPIA